MRKFSTHCATIILALAFLPAKLSAEDAALARLIHDFNGGNELKTYPLKASEKPGEAEILAQKVYGSLLSDIKTPATVFFCVWREVPRTIEELKVDSVAPEEIFVSCRFGPRNVQNPGKLGELGTLIYSDDSAVLQAIWKFEEGEFRLTRFDVEIESGSKHYPARSIRPELSQITVFENEMRFPSNNSDSFEFNISAELPYRNSFDNPKEDTIVSITLSGVAEPTPKWLNY
ncbi:hypothetical protein [Frigidibacter sp. SD6-1]|uniref:hypothetical protein n=1 Tax=Frigidibacter sp. SD6-1 TaxID=3032581 RepID=UPI0024E02A3B|nr:hypothetical protein [Frigidibacter sp. SD6-1]